ncbi:MAG: hypothetical protein PHS57_07375 [Alphaproteobacteria bacterium]|nr:hypothetical protein [Alphaproteobacteria bacterium]
MRYIPLSLLVALVALPSSAVGETGHVFGRYTCSTEVPCRSYDLSASEWVEEGQACLARGFGFKNENDVFDDFAGLDTDGCLTAREEKKNGKGGLAPVCCVIQKTPDTCVFQCKLVEK